MLNAEEWILLNCSVREDSWDSKEIKPINSKGNQSWILIRKTDAEAETLILWPPDTKSLFTGKDPDVRKDWRQEEKGATEDEWMDDTTDSMDMSLSRLWEMVKDREAWSATVHGAAHSQIQLVTTQQQLMVPLTCIFSPYKNPHFNFKMTCMTYWGIHTPSLNKIFWAKVSDFQTFGTQILRTSRITHSSFPHSLWKETKKWERQMICKQEFPSIVICRVECHTRCQLISSAEIAV